jgi:hypothetical protein
MGAAKTEAKHEGRRRRITVTSSLNDISMDLYITKDDVNGFSSAKIFAS